MPKEELARQALDMPDIPKVTVTGSLPEEFLDFDIVADGVIIYVTMASTGRFGTPSMMR